MSSATPARPHNPSPGAILRSLSAAAARVAKNEAMFREVNERIRAVSEPVVGFGQPMHAVCECSDQDCLEQLPVAVSEYEAVRAEATWFLVVTAHVNPKLERVVRHAEGYTVVEKEIEERFFVGTDPRA